MGVKKGLLVSLLVAALGVATTGCGFSGAGTLTLGYLAWDENVANSNLIKILLEDDLGYERVELKSAQDDVPGVFEGVASGESDAFLDAWLEAHRPFVDEYEGQIELSAEPWYEGETQFGIAVPDYMRGVRTISDIDSSGTAMITGIEPESVMMQEISADVVPSYELETSLVEASTPAMLAELEKAYAMEEPFVFLAWSPHWMNQEYDFHYLMDPKDAIGEVDEPARLHSVVREDLAEDDPVAYALIETMRLNEEQVGAMEMAINKAGDPESGVRDWLAENREVVLPWIAAAREAQDG